MRIKTIDYLLDHIIWLFIFALPVLAYFIMLARPEYMVTDFSSFMSDYFNFGDNLFYTSLYSVFGSDGVLNLVGENCDGIIRYLTYIFTGTLLHLVFDILIFVPRLCLKWVENISKKGDLD